jgi:hypothetical protein
MPFTNIKMMNARIIKLMVTVTKLPQANTGPISLAASNDKVGSAMRASVTSLESER